MGRSTTADDPRVTKSLAHQEPSTSDVGGVMSGHFGLTTRPTSEFVLLAQTPPVITPTTSDLVMVLVGERSDAARGEV